MYGEGGDSESGIKGAEAVDVVHHTEEYRRGKGSMCSQPLQIIHNAYPWRRARMKSCQSPVFERDFVVEADELHEHIAYQ